MEVGGGGGVGARNFHIGISSMVQKLSVALHSYFFEFFFLINHVSMVFKVAGKAKNPIFLV